MNKMYTFGLENMLTSVAIWFNFVWNLKKKFNSGKREEKELVDKPVRMVMQWGI